MTLKEAYDHIQGDYDAVMGRMLKEDRVLKFLGKFQNQTTMAKLTEAVNSADYPGVFAQAHDMKGVCANLGITKLQESASALCEACRDGEPKADVTALYSAVKKDYDDTIAVISKL